MPTPGAVNQKVRQGEGRHNRRGSIMQTIQEIPFGSNSASKYRLESKPPPLVHMYELSTIKYQGIYKTDTAQEEMICYCSVHL